MPGESDSRTGQDLEISRPPAARLRPLAVGIAALTGFSFPLVYILTTLYESGVSPAQPRVCLVLLLAGVALGVVAALLIHYYPVKVSSRLEPGLPRLPDRSSRPSEKVKTEAGAQQPTPATPGESENRYRRIFDQAAVGLFEFTAGGELLSVNPAFAGMLGSDSVQGIMTPGTAGHEEFRPICAELAQLVISGGGPVFLERAIERPGGGTFFAGLNAWPAHGESDEPPHLVGVMEDAAQRRLVERKREERSQQLRHAMKMEAVGVLAGGVAHGFNNLLQGILGYSELLLLDERAAGQRAFALEQIRDAAIKDGELTQQLLTFSRKLESDMRPTDLNYEIHAAARKLQAALPRTISVRMDLQEELPFVMTDPAQIEQVFINLAMHSRDAMPDGGALGIQTRSRVLDAEFCRNHAGLSEGEYVICTVAASCRGGEPGAPEPIFEPFHTTREVGEGTGLGLAIVYGIVSNHGGHVSCSSEAGVGTTAHVFLPAMESLPVTAKEEAAPLATGSEAILLVDDEAANRELGKQILLKFGYTLVTANDAETALDIYRAEGHRIDLVVLDVIMPGMGGEKCLENLIEINPEVKVIFSSGYLDEGFPERAAGNGAVGFVKKPYELRTLLEAVRKALDAPEKPETQ